MGRFAPQVGVLQSHGGTPGKMPPGKGYWTKPASSSLVGSILRPFGVRESNGANAFEGASMPEAATCPFCSYTVSPALAPSGALVCPMCRNSGQLHGHPQMVEQGQAVSAQMIAHMARLHKVVEGLSTAQASANTSAQAERDAALEARFADMTDKLGFVEARVSDIASTIRAWEAAAAEEVAQEREASEKLVAHETWTANHENAAPTIRWEDESLAEHPPTEAPSIQEDSVVARSAGPDDDPVDFSDVPPVMNLQGNRSNGPPTTQPEANPTVGSPESAQDILARDVAFASSAVAEATQTAFGQPLAVTELEATLGDIERKLQAIHDQ